jgi:hypothetical protein
LEKQKSALCEEIQRLENTQRKDDGLPRPSAEAVTNITAIAFDL